MFLFESKQFISDINVCIFIVLADLEVKEWMFFYPPCVCVLMPQLSQEMKDDSDIHPCTTRSLSLTQLCRRICPVDL